MGTDTGLTATELLHLALHATNSDQPDKALGHLKQLLDKEPENAKAIYMMGALHAEIGMYEQAIEELRKAEALDASLVTATFQLGLLELTCGNIEDAEAVWSKLDSLGEDHALVQFKRGMLHLVKDEFQKCVNALENGIAANDFNEDLNQDMQRVLEDARAAMDKSGDLQAEEKSEDQTASGHSLLMNAYGHEENEH